MSRRIAAGPGLRSRWAPRLYLIFVLVLLLTGIGQLAYRLSLPTDGWEVSVASNLPGFTYIKNLMDAPSGLQPGDQVVGLEGVAADWQTFQGSDVLRASWRVGATLDYTIIRQGQEIEVPVTLVHWQTEKWLPASLRDPGKVAGLSSMVILLVLALFVYSRQPGNAAAGTFLMIVAMFVSSTLSDLVPMGFSVWLDPVAGSLQQKFLLYLFGALLPFALIRFALVFPRPKPIQQRYPWLANGAGAIGLALYLLSPESFASWLWFISSFFIALAILSHNAFTMRDAVSRAQMRWGLGGIIIGFGLVALMLLVSTFGLIELDPAFWNWLTALAFTVMGSMLAVAILRYRLFDLDIIIRRTLVYGLLTALLALVYFGSVVALQSVFAALTGERSTLAVVLSTLIIAALFSPLRGRLQAIIDRRFFRRKYDAAQALGGFAAAARDEVDLDQLAAALLQVVNETVQPASARLWLAPSGSNRRSANA
jgi:hypothetical protein